MGSVFTLQHWEVFQKVTEVFILVPALLGLKGNLEMTLASRLSTAVSVLAGRRQARRIRGSSEPDLERTTGRSQLPSFAVRVWGGKVEGDPRLVVRLLGRGSLPRVVPRLSFSMSLDSCPTPCVATRLVTVCAALTGEHHAGPSTCTDGGLL